MTQGLITVMKGGEVVFKIIARIDDGIANVKRLIKAIAKLGRIPDLKEVYNIARKYAFGDESSLIVVAERNSYDRCSRRGGWSRRRLKESFHKPHINPCFAKGMPSFTKIVVL